MKHGLIIHVHRLPYMLHFSNTIRISPYVTVMFLSSKDLVGAVYSRPAGIRPKNQRIQIRGSQSNFL